MRILDSKDEGDRRIVADAPMIAGLPDRRRRRRSTPACSTTWTASACRSGRIPRIVRGLDYYGHTAFEFVTAKLGAQGTVMAGGRYDGLVAEMGGPPTPAVGWAAGIERLAMLLDDPPRRARARSPWCRSARRPKRRASASCNRCAPHGIRAEMAYRGNLRGGMERANRIGARAAVILGDDDLAAGRGAGEGPGDRQRRRRCRSPTSPSRLQMSLGTQTRPHRRPRGGTARDAVRGHLRRGLRQSASKELSEIEPVVARIGDLRAAERAQAEAEIAAGRSGDAGSGRSRTARAEGPDPRAGARDPPGAAAEGRGRRPLRHPGNPPRRRRRRGRPVRRRTVRDVPEIRRQQAAGGSRSWNTPTPSWAA